MCRKYWKGYKINSIFNPMKKGKYHMEKQAYPT
jgi:hypothetical protein